MTETEAREAIGQLVLAGAEVESRNVYGELLSLVPVGRDLFELVEDQVMLRPLLGQLADDERLPAPEDVRMQPLGAVRYDRLGGDAVGLAHESGGYSVIRATADPARLAAIARWDEIAPLYE